MTASHPHRLEGLEPDNLLAFLALLGLLRSLEAAGLRPRAHWEGLPLRPVLDLPEPTTQEAVAERAAAGVVRLVPLFDFSNVSKFAFSRCQLRNAIEYTICLDNDMSIIADLALSAFAVEGVHLRKAKKSGHEFERAPLDCLGGGKTDLAATLQDALRLSKRPDCGKKIATALFQAWKRRYDGKSLRWDQADLRLHAYAAKAPTKDHARQEWGANILGVIGTSVVGGFATNSTDGLGFLSLGCRIGPDKTVEFSWPIWEIPLSLTAIQALLGHPLVSADRPDQRRIRMASALTIYRSRKIWPMEYAVFTRAEVV